MSEPSEETRLEEWDARIVLRWSSFVSSASVLADVLRVEQVQQQASSSLRLLGIQARAQWTALQKGSDANPDLPAAFLERVAGTLRSLALTSQEDAPVSAALVVGDLLNKSSSLDTGEHLLSTLVTSLGVLFHFLPASADGAKLLQSLYVAPVVKTRVVDLCEGPTLNALKVVEACLKTSRAGILNYALSMDEIAPCTDVFRPVLQSDASPMAASFSRIQSIALLVRRGACCLVLLRASGWTMVTLGSEGALDSAQIQSFSRNTKTVVMSRANDFGGNTMLVDDSTVQLETEVLQAIHAWMEQSVRATVPGSTQARLLAPRLVLLFPVSSS